MVVVGSPKHGVVRVTVIDHGSRWCGQSTARRARDAVKQDGVITCCRYHLALGTY